jgi:hypothetical protein
MIGERAISLHFKVYSDEPNKVWHAEQQRWHTYDLDTKIAIYADRVRGWFLDFGRRFTSEHNCGFIVLMIGVSYLEGSQQFRDGESSDHKSRVTFRKAIRRLFPRISEQNADSVYLSVRNGLFHDAMTKAGVGIGAELPEALDVDGDGKILVNPDLFIAAVLADFDRYILELNSSERVDLRVNFEKLWDVRAPSYWLAPKA